MTMIETGIKGHQEMVVTEQMTATAVGSGKVRVLATPMMIALIEKAASLSIEPYLEPGQGSVGTRIDVTHTAPTPVGMKVWADTEVTVVDRRRIEFRVIAYDARGPIGSGIHERFLIVTEKFERKAAK